MTDEMFEKIGYTKHILENKWHNIWGVAYQNEKKYITINFDYLDKEFCIGTLEKNSEPIYVGVEELNAINQKFKEMGWL